jgi:hypothetical protein
VKPRHALLLVSALVLSIAAVVASPPADPIGIFSDHQDVGVVKLPGAAAYDPGSDEYTLQASGANMWLGTDQFHFAWKKIRGDFVLQAKVSFVGNGADPHRKVGLMVRSTLDTASPHVNVSRHGDGLTALQFRRSQGADTEEIRSAVNGPDFLQLERKGDTYTMSVARFGDTYSTSRLEDVKLGEEAYVGIFLCSHNADVLERAVLRNVRLTRPPGNVERRDGASHGVDPPS